ncbi:MAG: metal ABC transporter ATP-binding protein [Bacteroidetes bacterium]|nr:MAG: metal ABC transporter ATP-binding protein [Bacteroidota bacterium]
MTKPVISIKGLSVSYGNKIALTNIFLDIEPGKIYGIIGPNGAGKSTLFKAVLGLIEPTSGEVIFNFPSGKSRFKELVYVPQKEEVDWEFPATVLDIVLIGRYPHKKVLQPINARDREIALQALRDLGIEDLKNRQIGALSGGQQQRVFLARAMCQEASVFLLDEPFVGVDNMTEEKIIAILKQLAAAGKTILVVHHDLSSVAEYFDRVILLNQRLIAFGDTQSVFTEENIAKTYNSQLTILHKTGGVGLH